jgi:FemAB-related protein (PEP-CTERM system-associated)
LLRAGVACQEHASERVTVRPAAASDAAGWDAFVQRCPDATFFHRFGWREIIDDVFRHRSHYLVAERAGRITGILPLAEVKSRMFGHSLVSLPFCVYGGPAADDAGVEHALIEEATRLARALDVEYLELRNRAGKCPAWARQDIYVTFRRELLPETEANLLAVPRKQRAMIRKGIKNGLRGETDTSVDRFFALYADNAHRHGTPPFAKEYFARVLEVFGDSCEVLIIVDPQGRPVSGVMSFYFRGRSASLLCGRHGRGARPGRQRLQILGTDAARMRARPARFRLWSEQTRHRVLRLQEELGIRAGAAGVRISTSQAPGNPAEQSAQSEVPDADCDLAQAAASCCQRPRSAHRAQPGLISA